MQKSAQTARRHEDRGLGKLVEDINNNGSETTRSPVHRWQRSQAVD